MRQLEQNVAPAAEYEPDAQLEQLVDVAAPVVARYVPAAQLVHAEEPVFIWNDDAEQLIQTLAVTAEYMPMAQLRQLEKPQLP